MGRSYTLPGGFDVDQEPEPSRSHEGLPDLHVDPVADIPQSLPHLAPPSSPRLHGGIGSVVNESEVEESADRSWDPGPLSDYLENSTEPGVQDAANTLRCHKLSGDALLVLAEEDLKYLTEDDTVRNTLRSWWHGHRRDPRVVSRKTKVPRLCDIFSVDPSTQPNSSSVFDHGEPWNTAAENGHRRVLNDVRSVTPGPADDEFEWDLVGESSSDEDLGSRSSNSSSFVDIEHVDNPVTSDSSSSSRSEGDPESDVEAHHQGLLFSTQENDHAESSENAMLSSLEMSHPHELGSPSNDQGDPGHSAAQSAKGLIDNHDETSSHIDSLNTPSSLDLGYDSLQGESEGIPDSSTNISCNTASSATERAPAFHGGVADSAESTGSVTNGSEDISAPSVDNVAPHYDVISDSLSTNSLPVDHGDKENHSEHVSSPESGQDPSAVPDLLNTSSSLGPGCDPLIGGSGVSLASSGEASSQGGSVVRDGAMESGNISSPQDDNGDASAPSGDGVAREDISSNRANDPHPVNQDCGQDLSQDGFSSDSSQDISTKIAVPQDNPGIASSDKGNVEALSPSTPGISGGVVSSMMQRRPDVFNDTDDHGGAQANMKSLADASAHAGGTVTANGTTASATQAANAEDEQGPPGHTDSDRQNAPSASKTSTVIANTSSLGHGELEASSAHNSASSPTTEQPAVSPDVVVGSARANQLTLANSGVAGSAAPLVDATVTDSSARSNSVHNSHLTDQLNEGSRAEGMSSLDGAQDTLSVSQLPGNAPSATSSGPDCHSDEPTTSMASTVHQSPGAPSSVTEYMAGDCGSSPDQSTGEPLLSIPKGNEDVPSGTRMPANSPCASNSEPKRIPGEIETELSATMEVSHDDVPSVNGQEQDLSSSGDKRDSFQGAIAPLIDAAPILNSAILPDAVPSTFVHEFDSTGRSDVQSPSSTEPFVDGLSAQAVDNTVPLNSEPGFHLDRNDGQGLFAGTSPSADGPDASSTTEMLDNIPNPPLHEGKEVTDATETSGRQAPESPPIDFSEASAIATADFMRSLSSLRQSTPPFRSSLFGGDGLGESSRVNNSFSDDGYSSSPSTTFDDLLDDIESPWLPDAAASLHIHSVTNDPDHELDLENDASLSAASEEVYSSAPRDSAEVPDVFAPLPLQNLPSPNLLVELEELSPLFRMDSLTAGTGTHNPKTSARYLEELRPPSRKADDSLHDSPRSLWLPAASRSDHRRPQYSTEEQPEHGHRHAGRSRKQSPRNIDSGFAETVDLPNRSETTSIHIGVQADCGDSNEVQTLRRRIQELEARVAQLRALGRSQVAHLAPSPTQSPIRSIFSVLPWWQARPLTPTPRRTDDICNDLVSEVNTGSLPVPGMYDAHSHS